jgi:molybdenum cofactor synthesis domain-containing protein
VTKVNLLGKNELWITGISLKNADLKKISNTTAEVLGLPPEKVAVVNVLENIVVLDILTDTVELENVIGKKKELLEKLSKIPGVYLSPDASIHSEGILEVIDLDEEELLNSAEFINRIKSMADNIKAKISKRAIIFSTGFEINMGMIQDTNSPLLREFLEDMGYFVTLGGNLPDSADEIATAIRKAVDNGYGLIIITGGTGAEDKDQTIEGLLKVDPTAVTPYIIHYHVDGTRHKKPGVRIGVGEVELSKIICLPGPTDEVRASLEIISECLKRDCDKKEFAETLARKLKEYRLNKYELGQK